MPEWMPWPQLARLARLPSMRIAASWPKSPPAPPYSSGMEGQSRPSSPASAQVSRSISPCLRHFSNFGAHSSPMNFAVMSAIIWCSSVIHVDAICLSSLEDGLSLAVVQLGVEEPETGGQVLVICHAVEMLEQEAERLALVQPGLGGEALEPAIAVFRHGDGETAGEAEALGHEDPPRGVTGGGFPARVQNWSASSAITGSAPLSIRARCMAVAGRRRAI